SGKERLSTASWIIPGRIWSKPVAKEKLMALSFSSTKKPADGTVGWAIRCRGHSTASITSITGNGTLAGLTVDMTWSFISITDGMTSGVFPETGTYEAVTASPYRRLTPGWNFSLTSATMRLFRSSINSISVPPLMERQKGGATRNGPLACTMRTAATIPGPWITIRDSIIKGKTAHRYPTIRSAERL